MNRNINMILSAAVATVAGLGLGTAAVAGPDKTDKNKGTTIVIQDQKAQDGQAKLNEGSKVSTPTLPAGVVGQRDDAEAKDNSDVQDVLADALNAGAKTGGFNDLVERLVDQDRNRFGAWMGGPVNTRSFEEFDNAAKRFADAFEAKYGTELEIDEELFASVIVVRGEITDAEQVAANWPVKAIAAGSDSPTSPDEPRLAGDAQRDAHRDAQHDAKPHEGGEASKDAGQGAKTNEDGNIENGRQVAIAAVPGAEGKPTLNVSLLNEFPGTWKIDVPNDVEAEQVYTKLTQRLEKLSGQSDQWPAEADDARKLVAYEILASLYNVDADAKADKHDDLNGHKAEDAANSDGM